MRCQPRIVNAIAIPPPMSSTPGQGVCLSRIIAERIEVPQNALKKAVLDNMRAKNENARIVFEQKRTVNGKELLVLQNHSDVTTTVQMRLGADGPWTTYEVPANS